VTFDIFSTAEISPSKITAGEIAACIRGILPDLPMYVNSPWWPPFAAKIMLKYGGIDLVGCDGVLSSYEPGNILGTIQVEVTMQDGRKKKNIGFASEAPTENEKTIANLDVLPYYTIFGPYFGIGVLLWWVGNQRSWLFLRSHVSFASRESNTVRVLDDPMSVIRYGRALYPIKNMMVPIAKNRGTDGLWGWYLIRDPNSIKAHSRDVFGNVIVEPTVEIQAASAPKEPEDRVFIRHGIKYDEQKGEELDLDLAGMKFHCEGSPAGVIIWGPKEGNRQTGWMGVQQGKLTFTGYVSRQMTIEEGVFELYTENWVPGPAVKNEGISGTPAKLTVDKAKDVGELMCFDAKVFKFSYIS